MTRTRLLLAGLLCLIAVPVFAQVSDTYVIPAAGRAVGGASTNWLSEVYVFNPQQHSLKVSLVFLPSGVAAPIEKLLTVPANSTAFLDDVVGKVFNQNGTGSLLLATFPEDNPGVPDEMIQRAFVANSKTFNSVSGGSYGQSIEGTLTGLFDVRYDGITAISSGVQNWGVRGQSGYRTNVGAVNLGRSSVTMRVYVYDSLGNEVKNLPFVVPPMGHMQDSLPTTLQAGTVEFVIEDDPDWEDLTNYAIVFPYASVVDNRTGDPIYAKPVLLASANALFGKGTATAAAKTQRPVRRLDVNVARRVAENATSLGEVKLVLQDGRYVVAQ